MKKSLTFLLLLTTLWNCREDEPEKPTRSSAKELTSVTFTIEGESFVANAGNEYKVSLPPDTDLKNVPTPEVKVSPKATYKPKDHTDFSKPVVYTVTAQNGETQKYTLTVTKPNSSSPKELTSITFTIYGKPFVANAKNEYEVSLPSTVNLSDLPTPEVKVSPKATYKPKNHTNFSKPVTYTVTAEDGKTKKEYTLTVSRAEPAFRSVWKTTQDNQTITLPIHNLGKYNFTVDWGDDSQTQQVTTHDSEHRKHQYAKAGEHTITIKGELEGFSFGIIEDSRDHFISVQEWGRIALGNGNGFGHFRGCKSLRSFTTNDAPDLTQITSLEKLFYGAEKFNSDISHWKTEHITEMQDMFKGAVVFNNGGKPLNFNTAKVGDMNHMFFNASTFNQPFGENFKTASVINISGMFSDAKAFDQDISGWNMAKVQDIQFMFRNATAFNQDISGWNVDAVKSCSSFDLGATSFEYNNKPTALAKSCKSKLTAKKLISVTFTIGTETFTANQDKDSFNEYEVTLPPGTDPSNLSPPKVIVSNGANHNLTQTNFSNPVTITVTAENGETKDYTLTVAVRKVSSEKELTSVTFTIGTETFTATKWNEYKVTLPPDTDLNNLTTPQIEVSKYANYTPQNHTDFSKAVVYTVTAEDGETKQEYTLTVAVRKPSSEKELYLSFTTTDGKTFAASPVNNEYTISLPEDTDLANLTPTIQVSKGAKHNLSSTQTDFRNPVTITVTAENGDTQDYTITTTHSTGFRTRWRTTQDDKTITLPIWQVDPEDNRVVNTGTYHFTVDWGDGSSKQQVTSHNDEDREHTYATAGEYTVTITGTLEGFNFQIVPKSKTKLIEVIEWGGIALGTYYGHFTECENLEAFSQTDAPDLSKTQSLGRLLAGGDPFSKEFENKVFNSNMNHWDTKHITEMYAMFFGATAFNNGGHPVNFNTANVTDMNSMFQKASSFNQPFGENFSIAKLIQMQNMFNGATVFNQDLSGWKTNAGCQDFADNAPAFEDKNKPPGCGR